MSGRTHRPKPEEETHPGPGAYADINKNTRLKNAPKYGMGKSQRNIVSKTKASEPGPGSYNDRLVESKGGKFSFGGSRTNKSSNEATPGPGAYLNQNVRNMNEKKAGSYSMGTFL